ncbi:TetR/AcrR family transcriptional regulator [Nocardia sp. NPDC056000]|uniref:TetR/AcrR family transcriptional regulator n=1 Tax=Nocardia sp. NPDC056000 TaxID=3345674 RepID=UPI0035D56A8D
MVDSDPVDEKILDAALERILLLGVRRASLDDIARRAGMNRITIYRRFTTKDNLVEQVLRRELLRVLGEVTAVGRAAVGVDEQIEATMCALIRATLTHPFATRLLEVAPEDALSFYTLRGEELVQAGIFYIVGFAERGQRAGVLAPYEPRPVAELLARLAHSLLLTPNGGVDFNDEAQTRQFVRTTVVPLLKYGMGQPDTGLAAKSAES